MTTSDQIDRDLPVEMQGHWLDVDDASGALEIDGPLVTYKGQRVAYDFFEIEHEDGSISVSLCVTDPEREDEFQRENLTGLVIDPDGEFHAYNSRFASQFRRVG